MTNSEAARMFKAFCDEKRLDILAQLREGEWAVYIISPHEDLI